MKFIKLQTITEDGLASGECMVNAEAISFLTPHSISALSPLGKLAVTVITFQGGDRKLVLGCMEKVAAGIEEILCASQKQEPK